MRSGEKERGGPVNPRRWRMAVMEESSTWRRGTTDRWSVALTDARTNGIPRIFRRFPLQLNRLGQDLSLHVSLSEPILASEVVGTTGHSPTDNFHLFPTPVANRHDSRASAKRCAPDGWIPTPTHEFPSAHTQTHTTTKSTPHTTTPTLLYYATILL